MTLRTEMDDVGVDGAGREAHHGVQDRAGGRRAGLAIA